MTDERAKEIVLDIEKRQRKSDGKIYQTSHRHGIETLFSCGGLCSDSTGFGRLDADKRFDKACQLPNVEVVLYSRNVNRPFTVLNHN